MKKEIVFKILLCCGFLVQSCSSTSQSNFLKTNNLQRGKQVVIVAHPNCGFSNDFFKGVPLSLRKEIKKTFVITPINPRYESQELDAVKKWNMNSEYFHHTVDWRADTGPISLKSMPRFYFLNNGRVINFVRGWPKNGSNLSVLKSAFSKLQKL